MVSSEVEKIFRAFAEKRKAELPRFTPDGIPITMENKFDDAIYNYLYKYWKEQSGEYDPKKDVIPESEMNKMHPKTKNEKKFEQWLLQQYGMTKKEQRGYTLEGNLDSLWEIFSAADMVLLVKALPNIGKNLAKLGKNVGDDVAEEAIEKTVKKEAAEEMAESTAKKEVTDTAEDLSQKTVDKDDILEINEKIKEKSEILDDIRFKNGEPVHPIEKTLDHYLNPEGYAYEVAEKYGINLRGSGEKIIIKYNSELVSAGKSRKATPTIIELGPQAFVSEEELANTIAHELNHARDWLKGGNAPDWPTGMHPGAYSAGDALAEYIRGER